MKRPQPSDWLFGYSWLGFLNRFILRWLWLRLYIICQDEHSAPKQEWRDRVSHIGLYVAHPGAMYKDDIAISRFRKVLFEVKL